MRTCPVGNPKTFADKWVGWQTNPAWQSGDCRDGACPCLCPYGIQLFPVNGEAPNPPLEQLRVLPFTHPTSNCLLSIFVCGKGSHWVILFHLSRYQSSPSCAPSRYPRSFS